MVPHHHHYHHHHHHHLALSADRSDYDVIINKPVPNVFIKACQGSKQTPLTNVTYQSHDFMNPLVVKTTWKLDFNREYGESWRYPSR